MPQIVDEMLRYDKLRLLVRYYFVFFIISVEFVALRVQTGQMKLVTFKVAETLRGGENIVFLSEPEILRDRYFKVNCVRERFRP